MLLYLQTDFLFTEKFKAKIYLLLIMKYEKLPKIFLKLN